MKLRTTKKQVMKNCGKVISIGYCDLQFLLKFEDEFAYTAGTYGWNANIYAAPQGCTIVTGYRPFGNIKPDYSVVRKYNELAYEFIKNNRNLSELDLKKHCYELLNQFVSEVLKNA